MSGSTSTRSLATRPRVLVLTARGWYRHLSHTIVLDFEDAMAEVADVTWHELPPDAMSSTLRPQRSEVPVPAEGPYDLALFVAMAPSWLRALRGVRGIEDAARNFSVYVFDAWPYQLRSLRRWRRQVAWIDHLFVANPEAVDVYAPHLACPVHYLVQGTSPARFRPQQRERTIELLSVGRHHRGAHEQLLRLAHERDWLYVFADRTEPFTANLDASRYLTGALSRAARTHVSWAVEYTDPARAAGYSPVTARWFETAACASVPLGIPRGPARSASCSRTRTSSSSSTPRTPGSTVSSNRRWSATTSPNGSRWPRTSANSTPGNAGVIASWRPC